MQKPLSESKNTSYTIGSTTIPDTYLWLEDGKNDEVKKWVREQNEYTESIFRNNTQQVFSQELEKNFAFTSFSNPVPVCGKYFYTERKQNEDQMGLYVKEGLNTNPITIVNPNINPEKTTTIDFWAPGWTGRYTAYGLSEKGDEMATLYIFDVQTKRNLEETIPRCRYSQIKWLPDDSGFFYTRNPLPNTVPKNEEHLHVRVFFHPLGSNPLKDELIFGENRPKDDMITLSISLDGKYLAIEVSQKWTENDIYIYEVESKNFIPLVTGISAKFSVQFSNDKLLIHTNYKANNYRILSLPFSDINKPIDEWSEFHAEKDHLLESFTISKEYILLTYLQNVCNNIQIIDFDGHFVGSIPVPEFSSVSGISARRTEREFFYGVESFVLPKTTYYYNPDSQTYSLYQTTESPIVPNDYVVKQEWCKSKDSTPIPLFLFHKKNLEPNMPHPTILYGYGGFNSSITPAFFRNWLPWIEHGGIFVIANIRGGGEFGSEWHTSAIGSKNKQNSFDDFIACAKYLIQKGYTDNLHLGINGGSNGGLLVSTVGLQKPDLFGAICARVPLTDMIRFPQFGIAKRWIHEYGDPEKDEDRVNILSWSPYHIINTNQKYPPFLFTTGENDTRVDPLHSRKITAKLQNTEEQNTSFLFTEIDAGHGAGKPISKIVYIQSLILTFFAQNLGLKIK